MRSDCGCSTATDELLFILAGAVALNRSAWRHGPVWGTVNSMKSQTRALTQASLVSTAGRKAKRVQRKLHEAEAELHTANEILVHAVPTHDKESIDDAVEQNVAAEEKVHDAAQELEIVNALLTEADPTTQATGASPTSTGKTGQGAKSLIPHLNRKAAASL